MAAILLGAVSIVGCKKSADSVDFEPQCSCPHATIVLQPYDDFTQKEALKLKGDLEKHIDYILYGGFTVKVAANKHLSDEFLGISNTKYRADKIIGSLQDRAKQDSIILGVTHKDICVAKKNGHTDWRVLGLSSSSKHACVVSTHRIKHKSRDLWKVAMHEFIHTFYNYPHCPKDSIHCIMKDAKGHPDFSNKANLCGYCRDRIGLGHRLVKCKKGELIQRIRDFIQRRV